MATEDRLKDYIEVKDRVQEFYKKYPNGRIHTRIVKLDDIRVIVEAKVWKREPQEAISLYRGLTNTDAAKATPPAPSITEPPEYILHSITSADGIGQAEEIRASSFVNKTSALENAETSAIGRALAHMGFKVSKSLSSKDAASAALETQAELKKPIVATNLQNIYAMLTVLQIKPTDYEKKIGKSLEGLSNEDGMAIVATLRAGVERKRAEEAGRAEVAQSV
jgi:hypothetical protein